MPHLNTLRYHRRRWALTQTEVTRLVGLKARSAMSDHERNARWPALEVALAYQFLFDLPVGELFADTRQRVEETVVRRAAALDEVYRSRSDATSKLKLNFIQDLVARASVTPHS